MTKINFVVIWICVLWWMSCATLYFLTFITIFYFSNLTHSILFPLQVTCKFVREFQLLNDMPKCHKVTSYNNDQTSQNKDSKNAIDNVCYIALCCLGGRCKIIIEIAKPARTNSAISAKYDHICMMTRVSVRLRLSTYSIVTVKTDKFIK